MRRGKINEELRHLSSIFLFIYQASLMTQWVKNPPAEDTGDAGSILRRKWQLTPVFLPEKSHGQRSLAGYGAKGRKELDMTGWLNIQHVISIPKK